jgi:hypothetical protein
MVETTECVQRPGGPACVRRAALTGVWNAIAVDDDSRTSSTLMLQHALGALFVCVLLAQ